MTIEVMRKALEALDEARQCPVWPGSLKDAAGIEPAIAALRAEIERLEAAPDAYAIPLAPPGVDDTLFRLAFAEDVPMPVDPRAYRLYAWPVAPAIPALTYQELKSVMYPHSFSDARWAYALAAERAGVQIKDTLQELADDARQIGLEY